MNLQLAAALVRPSITVLATLLATALSACGGGGADGAAEVGAETNSLSRLQGTYVVACFSRFPGESEQGTLTIAAPAANGEVLGSLRWQSYSGSSACAANALAFDGTANAQLTSKSTTKAYVDATGRNVTANVLTVAYRGLTLSRGTIEFSIPALGAATDIAYVLDGNRLQVSKGSRGADGLGDSLSSIAAVKN